MKFAHISDIHLGFQKDPALQDVEQRVFEEALDRCISMGVDFVLMPGDIFHVNIPEMRVQKYAFAKFRQVYEAGIPVYVVYGSHDFSPVSNSVIDLLAAAGYIIKVTQATSNDDDGTISLDFISDSKTGAKITGLSGLKAGNDREYYEKLARAPLESEPGFKIFLFHGGIAEMKDGTANEGEMMPLSLLPKGFSYYAGGHMHKCLNREFEGYRHVVYPGTPFAGYHSDLENNARGQKRGFFIVEFEDDDVRSIDFVQLENARYEIIRIDATDKSAESVNLMLRQKVAEISPEDKVVIVKITGEMTHGKTADIDISAARLSLARRGSLVSMVNKNQLKSKEYAITEAKGADRREIETNVFFENIGQLRLDREDLTGECGVSLAGALLHRLGARQLANEKKAEYADRIKKDALATLGLDGDDS